MHVPRENTSAREKSLTELKLPLRCSRVGFANKVTRKAAIQTMLKTLAYLGANLMDPEDLKAKIGEHKVKNGTKMLNDLCLRCFP